MDLQSFLSSASQVGDIAKDHVHLPGLEPGPQAWEAYILPLNYRCPRVAKLPFFIYYRWYFPLQHCITEAFSPQAFLTASSEHHQ